MQIGREQQIALERYLDFSTDKRDFDAFQAGFNTHPELKLYSEDIQKYISTENPICAIRGLIGLHATTTAVFNIGAFRSWKITNSLLGAIVLLLAYIAFQLS